MARTINVHRRAVIEAQGILKAAARTAEGAGYTLPALLDRAGVKRSNWDAWMAGRALPRVASLEAIKAAVQSLAGGVPDGPGLWEYSNSEGQTLACEVVLAGDGLLYVDNENENKIFPVSRLRGTWKKIESQNK